METRIEIVAVIALLITGLSHILRPRAWVEFFKMLRDRGEAVVFAIALLHLPMALLIVIPIVLAVTFLAAYVPARRASRLNPMQALRHD